jgi:leader peptidase (prepilin peptidase)/N-methyltransferase
MVAWLATALVAVAATTACALRLNENPAVFACCYFAAVGTVLSAIDIAVMRLPDALTLPSYPVLLIALAWSSSTTGDTRSLYRGVEAAIIVLVVFVTQHLAAGVGLGDVKLAGLVGLLLGYLGWIVLFRGLFIACLIGAGWAAGHRACWRREHPLRTGSGCWRLDGDAGLVL